MGISASQEEVCWWYTCSSLQTIQCQSLATLCEYFLKLIVNLLRGRSFVLIQPLYDDVEFVVCGEHPHLNTEASVSGDRLSAQDGFDDPVAPRVFGDVTSAELNIDANQALAENFDRDADPSDTSV